MTARLAPASALAQALLPGLLLSGCASLVQPPQRAETVVVVVPSRHDGHVGSVVVNQGDRREVLNTAYAAARTTGDSREVSRTTMTAEDVNQRFADASAALPHRAVTYTLYFVVAKPELTPESSAEVDSLLSEVADRQAAQIVVTGYTDRMGSDERNDALSLARARMIRELVIKRGAAADIVTAVGMGERDPVVPTADGVAEPRNRRVDVLVR